MTTDPDGPITTRHRADGTSNQIVDGSDRRLGVSEFVVGAVAFGCWRFAGSTLSEARTLVETALESGMNLIDTADIYGVGGPGFGAAEDHLGAVFASSPGLRDRCVLATKGGIRPGVPYDSSPAAIRVACDDSLRRLRVERIDLYQIHRPDLLAHPADVAAALVELRAAGKVREVGVSNHTAAQFRSLQAHLPFPIATHQPELSAWHLDAIDDGVLDQCCELGVTPLAWSPLAGGRLATGEGLDGRGEAGAHLVGVLDRLATERGVDRTAVALAFVLALPSRPVAIIGTQNPDRIRTSTIARDIELDRAEVYEIIEASGRPLP